MYPSGVWEGFWVQEWYGRQPMEQFRLAFDRRGTVSGGGTDVVGVFTVRGECDPATGAVSFVKQYVGRHRVMYTGTPDGEGCIHGTWAITQDGPDYRGPFSLRPVVARPAGDAPIGEIG